MRAHIYSVSIYVKFLYHDYFLIRVVLKAGELLFGRDRIGGEQHSMTQTAFEWTAATQRHF